MRWCACLSLVLVLAAVPAASATLYRWIDPDGREAIGTTPPPGVNAVPWTPGQPATPPPAAAAPAPETPPATPAAAPATPTRSPAARAALAREERCQRALERENKRRSDIQKGEAEVAALEAKLARLQESELAYSRMECRNDVYAGDKPCSDTVFDRDREIERTEKALAKAQEKLDDLELGPRATVEAGCE